MTIAAFRLILSVPAKEVVDVAANEDEEDSAPQEVLSEVRRHQKFHEP